MEVNKEIDLMTLLKNHFTDDRKGFNRIEEQLKTIGQHLIRQDSTFEERWKRIEPVVVKSESAARRDEVFEAETDKWIKRFKWGSSFTVGLAAFIGAFIYIWYSIVESLK